MLVLLSHNINDGLTIHNYNYTDTGLVDTPFILQILFCRLIGPGGVFFLLYIPIGKRGSLAREPKKGCRAAIQ